MRICTKAFAVLGTAALFTMAAVAQTGSLKKNLAANSARPDASSPYTSNAGAAPADDYSVQFFRNAQQRLNYFDNDSDDYTVDIVDPGTNGTNETVNGYPAPSMCADIYVITPDEELAECCGCLLTSDQLMEINISPNLTTNNHTGGSIDNGTIKLISSAPGPGGTYNHFGLCDPATPIPTPSLKAWKVIAFDPNNDDLEITDNPFVSAPLTTLEESTLAKKCAFIEQNNSGKGLCTCPAQLSD